MKSVELGDVLTHTVVSVLEEAVYALVERADDDTAGTTEVFESLISFAGRYTGTISLEVDAGGVAAIANDFLGTDSSEPSDSASCDAIGELANIVAGRFLEAWLKSETDYDIGIPSVSRKLHKETRLATEPQVCVTRLRTDTGIHLAVAILLGVWS